VKLHLSNKTANINGKNLPAKSQHLNGKHHFDRSPSGTLSTPLPAKSRDKHVSASLKDAQVYCTSEKAYAYTADQGRPQDFG